MIHVAVAHVTSSREDGVGCLPDPGLSERAIPGVPQVDLQVKRVRTICLFTSLAQSPREPILRGVEADIAEDVNKPLIGRVFDVRLGVSVALHALEKCVELRVIGERNNSASLRSPKDRQASGTKRRRGNWAGEIEHEDELWVDAERGAALEMNGGKRSCSAVEVRAVDGSIAVDARPVPAAACVARAVRLSSNETKMR